MSVFGGKATTREMTATAYKGLIGVLVADCAAKLIRELDSCSGIGEAPSNVVASFVAAAAPVLGL